jgi:WD40 repeat protein
VWLRHASWALTTCLLAAAAPLPAAAPPAAATAARIARLVAQLGQDAPRWREAARQLEALGDASLPTLNRLARSDADVDVRLRAMVVARAIDNKVWGLVRAFGAGAVLKAAPWGGGYWINRVAFTPDRKYCVATGGAVILFDLATGKEVRRVLEVGGAREGLALSRDGKHCLTGHTNHPVAHLLEVPSLKEVRTFKGHGGGIWAVALSPDDSRAASTGKDRTIRVWDVKAGSLHKSWTIGTDGARSVSFSPDGKRLLSGHQGAGDSVVRLWDLEGKLLQTFTGHSSYVVAVAFLPDGRSALSASFDGTLRVWEVSSGKELRRMNHGSGVYHAALSADGKRALSAGFHDRMVRLWDVKTGKLLRTLDGHVWAVLGVAFSPDGRGALSSDSVTTVRHWKLGP